MRTFIDGRRYDTNSARIIGRRAIMDGLTEELYRKQTGEFFLHKNFEGSESIIPIEAEKARQWAKDVGIEISFENKNYRTWVSLPADLNVKAREYAEKNKMTVSAVCVKALEQFFS